ncbi:MAG TPA: RNA polymerase sigma factor RpoE, partial [Xanthomonadales bacterium]|nr:RNA polymerase sigma factor RpoE [Xanthomonadales bacterium]
MGDNEIDQEIVERVRQGDTRAFDLIVRKYQHKLTSLVSRYLSDWSECQDVVQETFIRA